MTEGDRSPISLLSVMVGMELASGVIGIGGRLEQKEGGIPFILTEAFWDRYWEKGVRPWKTALSLLILSVGILHTSQYSIPINGNFTSIKIHFHYGFPTHSCCTTYELILILLLNS